MITIGEFSRLGFISARMLRHYDSIGLLRPACIGENGYRYYTAEQLNVLLKIEKLKRYGFALNEIGAMLAMPQIELRERIHHKRMQLYADLAELRKVLRRMKEDIMTMEGAAMALEKYTPVLIEEGPQKIFGLRKNINIGEMSGLINEFLAITAKKGLSCCNFVQMMYHDQEISFENMDVEVMISVDRDGDGVRTLPGGTFLTVNHTGPYDGLHFAYEALTAWMAQHPEYRLCGPSRERYFNSPCEVAPAELETTILFPVVKN